MSNVQQHDSIWDGEREAYGRFLQAMMEATNSLRDAQDRAAKQLDAELREAQRLRLENLALEHMNSTGASF